MSNSSTPARGAHRCARRLLCVLLGAPTIVAAQTVAPNGGGNGPTSAAVGPAAMPSASNPRPTADAAPRSGPVSIDGRLDDAAWAAARPIAEFYQSNPD